MARLSGTCCWPRARRAAGDRRFAQFGECVVGAGRDAGDRHRSAGADDDAAGAAAAQNDDGRDTRSAIIRWRLSAGVAVTAMSGDSAGVKVHKISRDR